MLLLMVILD